MPYRDDEHALQAKKAELEQERARIAENKRALANLNEDEARIHRELADVDRRLAKRKKSLPVLGEVRIASPCHADWNLMTGDEQSRFCDKCAKNVYNLSAMTTEQAESLIREKEGDLCVRYYQRADGTVMTADCPVGARRKRIKVVAIAAGLGVAAGLGAHTYANQVVMGEIDVADTRMGKLEVFDGEMVEEEVTPTVQGALTPAYFEEREKTQPGAEAVLKSTKPGAEKVESPRQTRR